MKSFQALAGKAANAFREGMDGLARASRFAPWEDWVARRDSSRDKSRARKARLAIEAGDGAALAALIDGLPQRANLDTFVQAIQSAMISKALSADKDPKLESALSQAIGALQTPHGFAVASLCLNRSFSIVANMACGWSLPSFEWVVDRSLPSDPDSSLAALSVLCQDFAPLAGAFEAASRAARSGSLERKKNSAAILAGGVDMLAQLGEDLARLEKEFAGSEKSSWAEAGYVEALGAGPKALREAVLSACSQRALKGKAAPMLGRLQSLCDAKEIGEAAASPGKAAPKRSMAL